MLICAGARYTCLKLFINLDRDMYRILGTARQIRLQIYQYRNHFLSKLNIFYASVSKMIYAVFIDENDYRYFTRMINSNF